MHIKHTLLFVLFLFIQCNKEDNGNATKYTLNLVPSTGGVVTGEGEFAEGSVVRVTAQPDSEYVFSGWSNGSTSNPLEVTMSRNLTLTAFFTKKNYALTINRQGEGSVVKTVLSSGKTTEEFTSGTVLELNGIGAQGWRFTHWSGQVSSTNNPLQITLENPITLTAHFVPSQEGTESTSGTSLVADGEGNTYELITSVLAPNYDPVEPPDCNHSEFGRHIDEIYDEDLAKHVFRFHIHVSPDNDRCLNFDRQRNEIKTYDKSPENLLGREGETVEYEWKFKLPAGFQSSSKFTHIHQLKSVGGEYNSMPMYTLTTRQSNPDRLELRYAEIDRQTTLTQTALSAFVNRWVLVRETILYGRNGRYSIRLLDASTEEILFEYSNDAIVNWREGGEFVRPKWGIYRSLIYAEDLRDEQVLFADFKITETN